MVPWTKERADAVEYLHRSPRWGHEGDCRLRMAELRNQGLLGGIGLNAAEREELRVLGEEHTALVRLAYGVSS